MNIEIKMNQLPKSTSKLLWFFCMKQKWKMFVLFLICILTGFIPTVDSIMLKNLIEKIEFLEENKALSIFSSMGMWILGYALWWELINWSGRIYDYLYLKTMPEVKGKVLDTLYNYAQYHNHSFFQKNPAGDITNRIMEGSRSFEMIICITNEKIVTKISITLTALITLYFVHPVFSLVFFCWICAFCCISVIFSGEIAREYSVDYSKNKSRLAGAIVDTISNISSVRTFVNHLYERGYINRYITQGIDSEKSMQWFIFKLRYVLGLTCTIMIFFMLYYASILKSEHQITVGDVALIITLCLAVADNIWDLMREVSDLLEELGTFTQSMSLIEPYLLKDNKDAKELLVTKGVIEFHQVTFKYHHNNNIFADKTLVIKGGQKIGLVGYSGSGKTTFVNLINRLYNIESGSISIDNQDISNVTQDSLRRNITIIPQEPILFDRSIKENIAYAKINASDEEIYKAAKAVHLHDEILAMPKGYDTLCGELGNNLSGGQKKRIAIARAILKDSPILILDEATVALDGVTEDLIKESLKNLMKDKTVIVIAHKLSTLLDMDRILVFDKGAIVEDGTHNDLLKAQQLYYKLWRSQVVVL